MTSTSGDKKEAFLPSRRVSSIYESQIQISHHGNMQVRILALASGMGLVACSVLIWTRWIIDLRFAWFELVSSIAALAVGICAFILESDLSICERPKTIMIVNVPALGKVSGRGAMYAVTGMLQCAVFHALQLFVGLFTAIVGIHMIQVGQRASNSLTLLKKSITDEKALIKAFQANDRNGDGIMEIFEFDGLLLSLGIELDNDELDEAFRSIDSNNDNKIAYDEFRGWWKACTAEVDAGLFV